MSKIAIAMPCAQAAVKMQAMQTAVDIAVALKGAGHEVNFAAVEFADVIVARNYLASSALHGGADKLLFIDSDMSFPPSVAMELLAQDKAVIGAIYPTRQMALERVIDVARSKPKASPAEVMSSALNYVVRQTSGAYKFEKGVTEVEGIGFGATLIDGGVLKKMAGSGEARLTPHKGFGDFPMYGFFDLIESDGVMLSEDLSFCARWRAMGGQVHAMNSAHVGHVGAFVYRGSFFDKLRGA